MKKWFVLVVFRCWSPVVRFTFGHECKNLKNALILILWRVLIFHGCLDFLMDLVVSTSTEKKNYRRSPTGGVAEQVETS